MSLKERHRRRRFLNDLSTARILSSKGEYPITGERKWVIRKGMEWPKSVEEGMYPYVVMLDGEVRFSEKPRPETKIHHPELCNGKDVIGAGMFTVQDEKITNVSIESGHYCPDGNAIYYVMLAFRYWNLPIAEDVEIDTRWEVFG